MSIRTPHVALMASAALACASLAVTMWPSSDSSDSRSQGGHGARGRRANTRSWERMNKEAEDWYVGPWSKKK